VDHKQQEQVALHRWAVIAEAAGQNLTAAERGVSPQPPGTPSARTSKSDDLEALVQASDQDPRRDTPGGPITGNSVVPCSWQKTPQSGPMIMAGDKHPGLAQAQVDDREGDGWRRY